MAGIESQTTTTTVYPPPPNVKIFPATKEDIPALGRILTASHGPELMISFFFPDWPNLEAMVPYNTGRVAKSFEEGSEDLMFKAVLYESVDGGESKEEVVGMVKIAVQSGEKLDRGLVVKEDETKSENSNGVDVKEEGKMKMAAIPGMPEGLNMKFIGQIMKGLGGLDEVMLGRKYYLLSSLAVLPAHQGKGIGQLLMQHCNDVADKAKLPTYLTAFPGAYDLYLKMGYEDKRHFDIDLGEWSKKKYTGFGVYRSYGMIRELKGAAGIVDSV